MAEPQSIDQSQTQQTNSPFRAVEAWFADKPWLSALILVVITFLVYLPAMRAAFVFDDFSLITDNSLIHARDGLRRFWLTTQADDYYPMTYSLWYLEWRLWGSQARGYHMLNVLLHAANAVLLWKILARLRIPGAWSSALVFALHPVNVATVAWVSEQKNTLSMLFYAVAILLYLQFERDHRWHWYGISLLAFVLALLSKPMVVVLPAVLLGCQWWIRGRLQLKDFLRTAPFFGFSLALGLVTIWFQSNRAMLGHGGQVGNFAFRLALAGWVPWFYLHKTLLPANLMVIYPRWQINTSQWISYLPGTILLFSFIVLWWNRKTWGRALLFGWGYFVVTLFPVLGFFDQGFYRSSFVADHWLYHSMVGVIALVVAFGDWIRRRVCGHHPTLWLAVSLAVVAALAVATWSRACIYLDNETLWRDNAVRNPTSWAAFYNLGVALEEEGKDRDAIEPYETALKIKPDYVEAHDNLGNVLLHEGRFRDAIYHHEQAYRIVPNSSHTQNCLAWSLATVAPTDGGDAIRAVTLAKQACDLTNNRHPAYLDTLAAAYASTGRFKDAAKVAQAAINLANAAGQFAVAQEIGSRLMLYQANRAYQLPIAPRSSAGTP